VKRIYEWRQLCYFLLVLATARVLCGSLMMAAQLAGRTAGSKTCSGGNSTSETCGSGSPTQNPGDSRDSSPPVGLVRKVAESKDALQEFAQTTKKILNRSNGIVFANPFGGLDAANIECGLGVCINLAEPGMVNGIPKFDKWNPNTVIFDLRRTGARISVLPGTYTPFAIWARENTDLGSTEYKSAAVFNMLHTGGGHSGTNPLNGANKPSYFSSSDQLYSNRYGQEWGHDISVFKTGSGEAIGLLADVRCTGNSWTFGDEGCKGLKATTTQGNGPVFTGTVSSVVDNGTDLTLNFNSALVKDAAGEGRLAVRDQGQRTATISDVVGIPPVITLQGVDLVATYGSPHPRSDICISPAFNDAVRGSNIYQYWLPLRSIDSSTTATIDMKIAGNNAISWTGGRSGPARVAYCGQIIDLDQRDPTAHTGWIKVSKGTTVWRAGDTFSVPLGTSNPMVGLQVSTNQSTPFAANTGSAIAWFTHYGATIPYGLYVHGPMLNGIFFDMGTLTGQSTFGVHYGHAPTYLSLVDNAPSDHVFTEYFPDPTGAVYGQYTSSLKDPVHGPVRPLVAWGPTAALQFLPRLNGGTLTVSGTLSAPRINGITDRGVVANLNADMVDGRRISLSTVAFSTMPKFDAASTSAFKIMLSANVTSSTLANAVAGQQLSFIFCQDSTGGHKFTWPSNVKGGVAIGTIGSKCSAQTFVFDGSNAYATGSGVIDQ